MRSLFLVLPLLLATTGTSAQSPKPATSKTAVPRIDCANATATPELNHCAEIRLKKADSELAAALDKARAQIPKRAGTKAEWRVQWLASLNGAQQAWTGYREAECKGLTPYEWDGGTGTTLAVLECMAQMTEQRAYELAERYGEKR